MDRFGMFQSVSNLPFSSPRIGRLVTPVVCLAVIGAVLTAPVSLFAAPKAQTAAKPSATEPAAERVTYQVSSFDLRYLKAHPNLPTITSLAKLKVTVGVTQHGYVAPSRGLETRTVMLGDLASGKPKTFSAGAIQTILEAIRDDLTSQDLMGVFVAPDPADIGPQGQDLRKKGDTALHIVITVGRVTELRTVASGQRIPKDARIDNPLHDWIRKMSPIQPGHGDKPGSLLHSNILNDYVYRLNRHPGRRVDVALSPSNQEAGVDLDYLVTENKPWSVYAQLSNTGTKQTNKLREQFGFYDTQLTNNDDTLSVNYVTAGFKSAHAAQATYEAPLGDHNQFLRWGAHLRWGQYTASDVGFANDTFRGRSWDGGGQLIATLFQHRNLFVDGVAGARFEWMKVSNTLPGSSTGQEQFLLPHVGLRASMESEWYHLAADGIFEFSNGNWTGVSQSELNNLGRPGTDANWTDFRWNVNASVFLEPLLDYNAWANPNTPQSSTLAHELVFSFSGQQAFGHRLVPQEEAVVGGMYSVRGYPESYVAGDNSEVASIEYRFHVPRVFNIRPQAGQLFGHAFRFAPQYVYGLPDWDFVLKTFLDAGHVSSNGNSSAAAEPSATLVGTGVGFTVSYHRNVRFDLDWGFALKPVQDVSYGSNRVNFALTLLY